jgi:hypothetical protein
LSPSPGNKSHHLPGTSGPAGRLAMLKILYPVIMRSITARCMVKTNKENMTPEKR